MAKDNITYPSLITLDKIFTSSINKDIVDESFISNQLTFESPIGIESIITQYSNGIVSNAIFGETAIFDFDVIANFSGDVEFTVDWGVEVGTTIINSTLVNSVTQSLQTSILIPEGVDTNQTINVTDSLGGTYQVGYTVESSGLDNFIFSINTFLGDGLNQYQLPLPSGQTYDFYADKNNGDPLIHITAYNQAETLLTWSSGTIHQVTITGKVGGFSHSNAGDKLKIISVDQWGNVDFDYLINGFFGCSNLASVAEMITDNFNAISFSQTFRQCTNLSSNINNILDNTNITSLNLGFYLCSSITGVLPSFASRTNITTFAQAFNGCSSLTGGVPSFGNNTNTINFQSTFQNCTGLTIGPASDAFSGCTNATSFISCMFGCLNIVGSVPNFPTSSSSFQNLFYNCTGIVGTVTLSTFGSNTNVTTFSSTFRNTRITGIDSNSFSGCVNVTSFSDSFRDNPSLTGSIPDFSSNTLITIFTNCFYLCTGLNGTIPSFSANTAVTNFVNMFVNASGLTGNSQSLWLEGNNNLVPPNYDSGTPNGQNCYSGCAGLTDFATIPTYWK